MADTLSPKKRSERMSKIRSKDTKQEILVRQYLHNKGLRFRVNVSDLPGKPDIAIKKYRLVIFINGCFWHGHENCKIAHIPKSKSDWWRQKIDRNVARDKKVLSQYQSMGWKVIVLWECELAPKARSSTLISLHENIHTICHKKQ